MIIPLTKHTSLLDQIDDRLVLRVEDIFQRFDRDDDQALSTEEIMPYFIKHLGIPPENIETLFFEIDVNGDSVISKAELYDFLLTHDEDVVNPRQTINSRVKKRKTLKRLATKMLEDEQEVLVPDPELVR